MLINKITVRRLQKADAETQYDEFAGFLSACIKNGNVLGKEYRISSSAEALEAYVSVPEPTALDRNNYNSYMAAWLERLATVGLGKPAVIELGSDDEIDLCKCNDHPSSYILFTNYMMVTTPIYCGACWGLMPLYRLPHYEAHDEFNETLNWQSHFQAWDQLFMHSADERFAAKQMSSLNSNLTKEGRGICKQIEAATNKPTYYSLFRYYGRSLKSELARKCPGCGGDWLLPEKWHDFFDFRCDTCRLVSTISASFERK